MANKANVTITVTEPGNPKINQCVSVTLDFDSKTWSCPGDPKGLLDIESGIFETVAILGVLQLLQGAQEVGRFEQFKLQKDQTGDGTLTIAGILTNIDWRVTLVV